MKNKNPHAVTKQSILPTENYQTMSLLEKTQWFIMNNDILLHLPL